MKIAIWFKALDFFLHTRDRKQESRIKKSRLEQHKLVFNGLAIAWV